MDNLIELIKEKYPKLSKGHKAIATYIIEQYDKAAFMTASRLGEVTGVSESTVVRFPLELGFSGYPAFLKELNALVKNKLTSVQRLEVSSTRIDKEHVVKSVLQSDLNKIKMTLEEIDEKHINNIVDEILKAKRIFILGVRSSAPLASFMGFYFNLIFDNVRLVHTTSVSEMFEQIVNAGKGDVVIGISFPRYSRRTTKAMQLVQSQGATVIAITDSVKSPLAKCATYSIFARSDMNSFVDSLVAPLSIINAIIVSIGLKRKDQIQSTLAKLERIWDEYQVYEKGDISQTKPMD
ncbi:MAG: MurR/RpiR family transcriptional regulator [Clostridiaceae bacterium]|jgi:DNA-binding MurR/RpiR family transcriptional regulator|nr:MurR/RpiR family transcriptional regulator [Clostridiaceae bacterium]